MNKRRKLTQFIHRFDKGFTVVELLVASTVSLLLLAMALESTNSMRRLYMHDIVRTRLNEDIRGTLDIVGVNIRQSGENLARGFPAIQIIDGASGAPDHLVLHRNLLDEVLAVCVALTAGSTTSDIVFADGTTTQGCDYASNNRNYTSWQNYRLADSNQSVRAYIYNISSKAGEFFNFISETDTGTQYLISRQAGTWGNNYDVGSSAVYILEKWEFRVVDDVLQLIVDGQEDNALDVAFGIQDFQVSAHMNDGTDKSALTSADDWTDIAYLNLTISADDSFGGQSISSTLSSRYFPRNILSN